MSCFTDLITHAVPIEIHREKKSGTVRENPELQRVYVLVSAFRDGKDIVPIQFEVKELRGRNNVLYMAVVLTKTDLEVMDAGVPDNASNVPHLFSRSTISLQELFSNVNTKDGRFLKYVPDGFLNGEQLAAKREALQKQKAEYDSYGNAKLSSRDPAAKKLQQTLEKENAKLKEDVANLRELLKLQRTVTNGTKFTKTSVQAAAQWLKKSAGAKGDTKELVGLLNTFYEEIATSGTGSKSEIQLTWESLYDCAMPVVQWLQDHVDLKSERSEYAQNVLKQIRGNRIYLDESQKAEAAKRKPVKIELFLSDRMGSCSISV